MFPDRFLSSRLSLRPIEADDADAIFDAYAQDATVARYMTWRPHKEAATVVDYVFSCLATPLEFGRTYVITSRDRGVLLGAFELRCPETYRLEFGYVLRRSCWGQGLMTEALTEVVLWATRQPGVFRVSSFCDVDNVGSARVMAKAGLTREALLRRWIVHPNISDEPRDCYAYALTW